MTLTVLRCTGHLFSRMSLRWDLLDAFLMISLGRWVFRRRTTEISPCSSHPIKSTYYQLDLSLWMWTLIWLWWCLPCCVCSSFWGAILPDIKVSQGASCKLGQPGGLVSPWPLPLWDLASLSLNRQFGFWGHTASLILGTGKEKKQKS